MRNIQTGVLAVAACAALSTTTACGSSKDTEGGSETPNETATASSTPTASPGAAGSQLDRALRAVGRVRGMLASVSHAVLHEADRAVVVTPADATSGPVAQP